MIRTPIDAFFLERARLHHARQTLRRAGARAVADALFRLNHVAKGPVTAEQRDAIYTLKSLVVRDFVARGFCTRVFRHASARDVLGRAVVCFVFQVGGQLYLWHQIARDAAWCDGLALTGAGDGDGDEGPPGKPGDSAADYALLVAYLRGRGVAALPPLDVFSPARERLHDKQALPRKGKLRGKWGKRP